MSNETFNIGPIPIITVYVYIDNNLRSKMADSRRVFAPNQVAGKLGRMPRRGCTGVPSFSQSLNN